MRKIFLLISVLVLTLAANAKEINISPNYPHSSGNNLLATLAAEGTKDGDVIILADGTYNESSNYIVFDKSVEVRAAEGANPIVEVETYIKIGENAANKNITIRGIKFDAEKQGPTGTTANTYSHFIRVYSAGTLDFEDCEFCNTQANKVIKVEADKHLGYLKINNCYFHDGNNSAVHIYQATDAHACDKIEITNSTFANYFGFSDGLVEVFTKGGALAADPADDAEFTMDHCTFYNYIKTSDNTYGFVDVRKSSKTTVSNCVFMNPTIPDGSYNAYATYTYGGTVTNCIYHNTRGNRVSPTGSSDADPLFIDAANGDYSLHGASPARTGNAGYPIGDPRWATEIRPSTDFSTPLILAGIDATLANKIELDASYYLHQKNDEDAALYGTATWLFNAEKSGNIQVTLNMSDATTSGHIYQVEIFDENEISCGSLSESGWDNNTNDKILSGSIALPQVGNYKVVLSNNQEWSGATIKGITLSYLGGATIDIPATLPLSDVILSNYARIDQTGAVDTICFAREGHESDASDAEYTIAGSQSAKWNIHVTKTGKYIFTANTFCRQGHNYRIMILNEDESSTIYTKQEAADDTYSWASQKADLLVSTDPIDLSAGNYVLKIQAKAYGRVTSVIATYEGGAVIDVPGQILGEDALLYKTGSKYMIRTEEGYLKSSNNGAPTSEWAVWNIAATAGTMNVTLNLDPVTSSGHNYRVELYDGDVLKDYAEELASAELSDAVHSKGDVALEKKLVIPTDGNYTIKLINRTQWSSMILQGITFTPAAVLTTVPMNDTDEDNTAWVGNVGGAAVNVELSRTFTGGMYNTICLPFAVSSDKVLDAFGSGVELIYMTGATLDGTVLDLEFAPTTSIYQGTPYLIKPAADVVNPQFTAVEFALSDASATGGTNADFIGTFVKKTIPGDPNNLYLQANNMLQFSQSDVTIKGMRAYFHVKVPISSPVVHPRIVLNGQVLTDIELVNGEPQTNGKFIENGQLIIIRDGIRYNAIGIRVK